jgi:endoglucanase
MRALPCLGIAALTAISGIGIEAGSSSRAATSDSTNAGPSAYVVLDSVGYTPAEVKHAYLVTKAPVSHPTLRVTDSAGHQVLTQAAATDVGRWNARYQHVYEFTFSSLATPGTYEVHITGPVTATSPSFEIESAASLYGGIVSKGVTFFQNQRDGANVIPGALQRRPSHLDDRHASVYALPHFRTPPATTSLTGGCTGSAT